MTDTELGLLGSLVYVGSLVPADWLFADDVEKSKKSFAAINIF